ncbi:MAG: flagellar motor protein MotB [Sphingomonadales bacterium]
MARHRRGGPSWLIIFADLMALLLTFFVLLFSMQSVKVDGWQAIVGTLTERLNPSRPKIVSSPQKDAEVSGVLVPTAMDLDYLGNIIEIKVADDPILGQSIIRRFKDRLVLSVPTDLLFEPGRADLASEAAQVTAELGEMFRSLGNGISVAGHAEPFKDLDSEFANHWDLSLARAVAIARALRRGGYLRPIQAYGQGQAHFDAIAGAGSKFGISRFSRRVDIVIRNARAAGASHDG